MDEKRLADRQRKHEDTVKELKKHCFDTPKLRDWCFAQDSGANPQMKHARFYADNFDRMLFYYTNYRFSFYLLYPLYFLSTIPGK